MVNNLIGVDVTFVSCWCFTPRTFTVATRSWTSCWVGGVGSPSGLRVKCRSDSQMELAPGSRPGTSARTIYTLHGDDPLKQFACSLVA